MKMTGKPFVLLLAIFAVSCSAQKDEQAAENQSSEAAPPPLAYQLALPEDLRAAVDKSFTGDLDAMVQRRIIRAGVPFNRTFYFVDQGVQRGLSYEYLMLFEEQLNKKLNSGNLKIHVVLLPMPRDMLLPSLQSGKLDMVVAQLTVTPERQKLVDFTNPTRTGVNEVVVTGPDAPPLDSLDDLSGKKVFVRRSSSYYASLVGQNAKLKTQGKAPIDIEEASESLEDDDLLEMVNAGLIPATVVDNFLADYWKQIFPDLTIHNNLAVRTGGNLAVALRKNSPQFAAELNAFIADHGLTSVIGRVLSKRYLQGTKYVQNATSEAERKKFLAMRDLFQRYGQQYEFDYLLMAAQAYQESKLDQDAKSHVGAIGVMQLMPATGEEQKVGDVRQLEPNIHAGVKYMRFMRNQYFEGEPMTALNKGLFTFASYNAGPGRIRQLRRETAQRGLDPNVWFGNVERIASERIGRETVTYVGNIYKYYIAYRLITEEQARRAAAKSELQKGKR
ncbi:transglycosylase SLT domain-containing protein [Sphingomonas sp. LaA6.9]|uniref:transglycosylase SLT domain-containing protein n=1 Tax=Sphingomonas sp. LaA6.9 TaxID=2919914 RepID=UPI001F503DBE|nr:transporter substrate-binding domain-containing protein [Sphingomonas sp. LaA6.9]MCJ8156160.1 transporter substrate-binding domain-containing protein [Sphingomonas sp. LaA6.9]